MSLPPFTLVYQSHDLLPEESTANQAPLLGKDAQVRAFLASQLEYIRRAAPDLIDPIASLHPALQRTLLAGTFAQAVAEAGADAIATLKPVIEDLRRRDDVTTVALWDIDARVGGLPRIIEALNRAQELFTFFELQAPLPAGIVSRPERIIAWVRKRLHQQDKRLSKKAREEITHNVIANDFFKHATAVYQRLGVKYLVGITQGMIAGEEDDGSLYWNFFTDTDGARLLISSHDVRRYAKEAGRPFQVAIMMLVVAQVLLDVNAEAGLDVHPDTGCIFDENIHRDNVVISIRELKIEDRCLSLMDEKYREAAVKMMDVLRSYPGEEPEASPAADEEFDTDYWLELLTKLGEE
jgi:hypothetical protein